MGISKDKFRGCLLGGAVGDAMGGPIEFLLSSEIKMKYGKDGCKDLVVDQFGKCNITDDTQMTLFTAEGLLLAMKQGVTSETIIHMHDAYLAWLCTQGEYIGHKNFSQFKLMNHKELFVKRAPGLTCIESLKSGKMGTLYNPINNSKGCGGVMRVAPVGLMFESRKAFQIGCECGAITHGHPSGYISAGILACILAEIISEKGLEDSVKFALNVAKEYDGHEECIKAINKALFLVEEDNDSEFAIKQIGEGWVGEEALAIAIYCSLKYKYDFRKAIIASVNHDGDSDSTGAITGNILGAYCGMKKIPKEWIGKLELLEAITEMADDIYKYRQLSDFK